MLKKKSAGLSKLPSMCPGERFFEKSGFFGKNLFLYQFGTWGKKFGLLSNLFPLLCQYFILPVHRNNLMKFFKKLTTLLLTFWHLTEENNSLSSRKFCWGSQNFCSTCPQERLVEKKVRKFWFFYQCRKLIFGLWQNFYCGVVGTAFYMPIGTFWLEKVLLRKLLFLLWHFAFSHLEREQLAFLAKTFRLVCQNCNLPDLKHIVENYFFSKKNHFCFFLFCQRRKLNKNLSVSSKKSAGLSKRHSLCPEKRFFEKTKLLEIFFQSFWDMRWNFLAFCQIFSPRLCQIFNLPVHRTISEIFFQKSNVLVMVCWPLTNKFQPFVKKALAG